MSFLRASTVVLCLSLLAITLQGQTASPALDAIPGTTYGPVPNVTFGGDRKLTYRYAWAIVASADSAGQITPEFLAPLRVLNTLIADGVPANRIHLAIVARGPAAVDMLDNDAYRAVMQRDNPNLPILRELAARGVRLIVCGQTMVGRNLPRDGFPSFVLMSRAATVAQARLAAEGFTFNPF